MRDPMNRTTNAKREFQSHIVVQPKIIAARISYRDEDWNEQLQDFNDIRKNSMLYLGYTKEEYDKFLESLDYMYDSGWGTQYLYGEIFYEDGSWSDRGEYDGQELWQYQVRPNLPERPYYQIKRLNQALKILCNDYICKYIMMEIIYNEFQDPLVRNQGVSNDHTYYEIFHML